MNYLIVKNLTHEEKIIIYNGLMVSDNKQDQ